MKKFCSCFVDNYRRPFRRPDFLAEEPAEAFLEALRERGYYDVAIDYLDGLENSDLISAEFRKTLPFEKAQTLISSTDNMGDMNLVEVRLDQAQQLLNNTRTKSIRSRHFGKRFCTKAICTIAVPKFFSSAANPID